MSQLPPTVHLKCPPEIQWVREAEQILVVDGRVGQVHTLRGVDAAVWSWLSLAYPYSKIIAFISEMLGAPAEEAERRLAKILQSWLAAGLLESEEAAGG